MARRVTCKICKTKGDTDSFYKVTNNKGVNTYYCNKEEYEKLINEKEKRHRLLEYIAVEVLEYEEGQIVPPSMLKKIGEMNKFYDLEVIMETFKQNKETIQFWIRTKNFSSEYGMASYTMRIIESNINDVYAKWKHMKKSEIKQDCNSLDLEIINEITNEPIKTEKNGILSFLDEEDM